MRFGNDVESARANAKPVLEEIGVDAGDALVCYSCTLSLICGTKPQLAVNDGFNYPPKLESLPRRARGNGCQVSELTRGP